MKYDFPKIELTEPEQIWMERLLYYQKKGEDPNYRELWSDLHEKVPPGFNHEKIDSRLAHYDRLTLYGIWHLDPNTDLIEKTDKVIYKIKEKLLNNPKLEDFNSENLAKEMELPKGDISLIFELFRDFGRFYDSASGSGGIGLDSISIRDYNTFNQYRFFEGIEPLLTSFSQKGKNESDYLDIPDIYGEVEVEEKKVTEVNPYFRSSIEYTDYKLCFVLMPFSPEWSGRVNTLLKDTIEKMGLQCIRADNLTGQIVIEDIWIKINQSAFIIADITTRNPNVLYELGLVHTIGKPSILLTQDFTDIPFDFKHLRHYEYQDNIDSFKVLEEKLPSIIKGLYQEFYPDILF